MKKSLSVPNLPSHLTTQKKVSNNRDTRTKALPIPFVDLLTLEPFYALSMESVYHVSFKTAHDCSMLYPEFVLGKTHNLDKDAENNLAICLATPDDTIIPERVADEDLQNRMGRSRTVRIRRKSQSAEP